MFVFFFMVVREEETELLWSFTDVIIRSSFFLLNCLYVYISHLE